MTMQGGVSFGRRGSSPAPAPVRPAPAADFLAPGPVPADDDAPLSRVPFATLTILVFLALIFLLELTDKPTARPGVVALGSLMHLGAVSRDFVLMDGQAWRLLTAPWLHASASHFFGNAVALVLIGIVLEPIIGWRWFAAAYTFGGIGGALGSIALNEKSIVSVGASGAIMAVMACAAAMSLHPAAVGRRGRIWRLCAISGIPALLPTSSSSHVDYSAHAGGAIAGFIVGYVLLVAWQTGKRRPPLEGLVATTGAVIGFLGLSAVAAAAVLPPARLHLQVTQGLIPPDQMPATDEEGVKRAVELEATYPDDPRAHALAARMWEKNGGDGAAEQELRKGLASPLLHAPEIPAGLEQDMRIMLVGVQLKQKEVYEATRSAEPLCPGLTTLDPRVQDVLKRLKACDAR
jgi:rhomboid protease GluP